MIASADAKAHSAEFAATFTDASHADTETRRERGNSKRSTEADRQSIGLADRSPNGPHTCVR